MFQACCSALSCCTLSATFVNYCIEVHSLQIVNIIGRLVWSHSLRVDYHLLGVTFKNCVHSKIGSFKKSSCCFDLQSTFQKKRFTFEVHKNPIFAVFPSTYCACFKTQSSATNHSRLWGIDFFTWLESGCGLALTQVAGKEAHMWCDQQWGLWEAAVVARFQELGAACYYAL